MTDTTHFPEDPRFPVNGTSVLTAFDSWKLGQDFDQAAERYQREFDAAAAVYAKNHADDLAKKESQTP